MKKLLSLFILISIFATGCSSIVNYSVKELDVRSADVNVKKWIESNGKANGIYIGRINESEEGNIYYLYVNYKNPVDKKSIDSVSIDSNGKKSILIDVKLRPSDQVNEKLFCITVKDKSLEKIVLNGEDITTSSIPIIE
ncbi:hypothetical protein SAMN04487895_12357 [Paenibacillus sophorae]|uniref:Lipoprotein n=1 Tax=Paenibacillus sophorae TaxID=1333845 RepID=A0A1H8VEL5_9BACL|nr:hypothetical protein [Paenibacillus sophorae]QWU16653.1 hypothetical protein KP014_05370 [Paenibacillus sophorae]SEP13835.1 hypothetical protein SAMN04487895_12357 [Paenibacillus sophorae]